MTPANSALRRSRLTITSMLRDPPAFRHVRDAARRTIERDYSVDVCLPRIKAFFEEVAGKGPRTPRGHPHVSTRPASVERAGGSAVSSGFKWWCGRLARVFYCEAGTIAGSGISALRRNDPVQGRR